MSNSWQENLYAFKDDEQIFLELNYFWVLNLYHEKKKTTWNCWERKKGKQVRKEERNLFTQVLIYSSVIIKSVSCISVKLHFIRLTKQRGKLNLSYPTEGGFCHSPAACFCPGTASSLCCWAVIPVWVNLAHIMFHKLILTHLWFWRKLPFICFCGQQCTHFSIQQLPWKLLIFHQPARIKASVCGGRKLLRCQEGFNKNGENDETVAEIQPIEN